MTLLSHYMIELVAHPITSMTSSNNFPKVDCLQLPEIEKKLGNNFWEVGKVQ